jgi:hypothetical protein
MNVENANSSEYINWIADLKSKIQSAQLKASKIVAEYALRGITQPIGIAEYELSKGIPKNLKSDLPTIEKVEKELATIFAKKNNRAAGRQHFLA